MSGYEEKKVNWKKVTAIAATSLLSVYTIVALQGPHGIGALRTQLARIRALNEQQQNLSKELADKKKRVESLERGQNIDLEMRRFGRTLPDEVEYKVAEPDVAAPPEDSGTPPR